MDWDDLKYVLMVARQGTYSAAADALKVNQTTVTRRIQSASDRLQTPLFDRVDGQLVPTAACQAVLAHAERVEQEVANALHAAADLRTTPSGIVRLTAVEGLIVDLIAPGLSAFHADFPDIRMELIAGDANLNLSRREADIALRMNRPTGGTSVTRKLCDMGFALYHSTDTGRPGYLTYDEAMEHLPEAQWLRRHFKDTAPNLRSNSPRLLRRAAADGLGSAMLGCFRADRDPRLTRAFPDDPPQVRREVWLIIHETARNNPAVRAAVGWIDSLIQANHAALSG